MRLLAVAAMLLALLMIVVSTHMLVTDVLPFTDWQSATSQPAPTSVQLP